MSGRTDGPELGLEGGRLSRGEVGRVGQHTDVDCVRGQDGQLVLVRGDDQLPDLAGDRGLDDLEEENHVSTQCGHVGCAVCAESRGFVATYPVAGSLGKTACLLIVDLEGAIGAISVEVACGAGP